MKYQLPVEKIDYAFIRSLILTLMFYLLRTAFWPLMYFFIAGSILTLILYVLLQNRQLFIIDYVKSFRLPLLLSCFYVIIYIFDGEYLNPIIIKDILLLIVLLALFYMLFWYLRFSRNKFPSAFLRQSLLFSIISIGLINILYEIFYQDISLEIKNLLNLSTSVTIAQDYNFFSLVMIYGIVLLNFNQTQDKIKNIYNSFFNILLTIILVNNVLLSTSRRGIFVLLVIFLIYLIISLFKNRRKQNLRLLLKKLLIVSGILLVFIVLGLFITSFLPRERKTKMLFHFSPMIGIVDYDELDRFLWDRTIPDRIEQDHLIEKKSIAEKPEYWASIYADGSLLSEEMTPYGPGMKISNSEAGNNGFSLFYKGPSIIYLSSHTYKISFKIKFIRGNFDSFKTGWWVKDGGHEYSRTYDLIKKVDTLDNGWFNCSASYTFIDNHLSPTGFINSVKEQTEFVISDFELVDIDFDPLLPSYFAQIKDKLHPQQWINEIYPPLGADSNLIMNGNFQLGLKYWKTDADSVKISVQSDGSQKYADIKRGNGNEGNWSLKYDGRIVKFKKNNEYQLSFRVKNVSKGILPFKTGFWVNEGEGFAYDLKLDIDSLSDGWLNVKTKYLFRNDQESLIFPINSQADYSQFYVTDFRLNNLTEYQENHQLFSKKSKENLMFSRFSRWSYSLTLWKNEYKWYNKVFGHGFNYLEWYGNKFLKNGEKYDWPHNPIISILLYSGIFGLILYLWLLFAAIRLYFKFRFYYGIFFICFIITYFFSFFSGASPFDPPLMGFFLLFPFLINSLQQNNNYQITDN